MSLENELQDFFKNLYTKIWIQFTKGSQSICVTVFPININQQYKIIIRYGWLKENELNFENIKNLILSHDEQH